MESMKIVKEYIASSISTKENLLRADTALEAILKAAEIQIDSLRQEKKIIFAGNGGSAADAQHLSAEYISKLKRDRDPLSAIALTTDTSALTAIANDYGYERLFARQLQGIGRPGDVFVGITTSGNSANLVEAFKQAKAMNITTIGFFGFKCGNCDGLVDVAINIPSQNTANIQESHIMIGHIICALVESELCFD